MKSLYDKEYSLLLKFRICYIFVVLFSTWKHILFVPKMKWNVRACVCVCLVHVIFSPFQFMYLYQRKWLIPFLLPLMVRRHFTCRVPFYTISTYDKLSDKILFNSVSPYRNIWQALYRKVLFSVKYQCTWNGISKKSQPCKAFSVYSLIKRLSLTKNLVCFPFITFPL